MVDLAARWLGGSVMAASDESFGLKENLLVEAEPDFTPGTFDHRGEVVDGWETRRRRPGTANPSGEHDWAIVRLGAAGVIETVDVDTRFFTGNFPTRARVQALAAPGYPRTEELVGAAWTEIVPWTDLKGDSHNLLAVPSPQRWTHVRLSAHPDGGVARLRVHGAVVPDRTLWGPSVELTSAAEGARVVSCSDAFYTSADRLLRPDRPRTMGEGWETARRRDEGHDSVVVALAAEGSLHRVEIDTSHFKYNASAEVEVWGRARGAWVPVLARTPLVPDTLHRFAVSTGPLAQLRLDAYPDGGLARFKAFGTPRETEPP